LTRLLEYFVGFYEMQPWVSWFLEGFTMLNRLWKDESGAIISLEIVLIGTILGIGVITGLSSLRDAVITELADVGGAIAWLDQSFHYHGSTAHSASTASTWHQDAPDFCDLDTPTPNSRCLIICNGEFAQDAGFNEGQGAGNP
jgi:Flp pilus assembly pilin Flp